MCSETTPIQGAAAKTGAGNNRRNFALGVWVTCFADWCLGLSGLYVYAINVRRQKKQRIETGGETSERTRRSL